MASISQPKRVLILGANGKVGRLLTAQWQAKPTEGIEFTNVFRNNAPEDGIVWAPGQPTDRLPQVDCIIGLWGVTSGDVSELSLNGKLALETIALGEALNARSVIHISSAAVYAPSVLPITEDSATSPLSPYGASKLEMERLVAARTTSLVQTISRIGNVAGADSLFNSIAKGTPLTLDQFPDGTGPSRSYIAAPDLLDVLASFVRNPTSGVFNVAAPLPTPMAAIARAAGCEVRWRNAPANAVQTVFLDTTRLSSVCAVPDSAADAAYLARWAKDEAVLT